METANETTDVTTDVTTDDTTDVDETNTDDVVDDKEVKTPPAKEPTLEEKLETFKAASRKHEANSRANLKKLRENEELLNAALQEKEELTAQLETFKKEAEVNLRKNIALKFGLSDLVASRLQGTTSEELEADAEKWAEELKVSNQRPNPFQGAIKNKLDEAGPKSLLAQALGD